MIVVIAEKVIDQWYFGCLAELGDCVCCSSENTEL